MDFKPIERPTEFVRQAVISNKNTSFDNPSGFVKQPFEQNNSNNPSENTPIIPKEVYENLPQFLKEGSEVFSTNREKDVFLTGALTVLSGCLPTISGNYNGSRVYANLYSFIVAPAASGKGVMSWAKVLGIAYHKYLREEYKTAYEEHEVSMKTYEQSKGQMDKPNPPPFRLLFSPADTSKASLIQTLSDCGESVTMFESEADTLSGTMGKEWGGFSDLFRKAFHHEPYSYQRKTANQYIELEFPRLSVALSGTPLQVQRLIPSAEDGLFSRFLFYVFRVEPHWQDVSPFKGRVPLNEYFAELSEKVKFMILHYESEGSINFSFQEHQWMKLNASFRDRLEDVKNLVGEDALSVVKRLGLITFRIAIILSILRKYNCGNGTPTELYCEDIDFNSAMILTEVYLNHSLIIFSSLTKETNKGNGTKKAFYDRLPAQFERKEAGLIGSEMTLSDRTIGNYLSDFVKNEYLTQPKYGYYQKNK
jgi:hypothetical protein